MKRFFFLIVSVARALHVSAQSKISVKPDIEVKANGEIMEGKVTRITDADIHFVYKYL